jgi:hypothetical protein
LVGKAAIFPALAKRIAAAWAIEQAARETARAIEAAIWEIAGAARETARAIEAAIWEIAGAVRETARAIEVAIWEIDQAREIEQVWEIARAVLVAAIET